MAQPRHAESGHFHAVKFYKDAGSLAQLVCSFLGDGLKHGEPAVLIATPDHAAYFRECFSSKDIDVEAAIASGRLTILDADEALAKFMRDGVPMAQPFNDTIGPVLKAVAAQHPGASIRAYGEMVDVLWRTGHTAAAIRLETLWNDLARSHDFQLLCGYAMGSFYKGSATEEICSVHSHVATDTGGYARVS
jgi:hypothetical protein